MPPSLVRHRRRRALILLRGALRQPASEVAPQVIDLRYKFVDLTEAFMKALGALSYVPVLRADVGVSLHLLAYALQKPLRSV